MTEIWTLRPNWRDSYSVTHAFKTDIIPSESGREQRRALRATPRKTVEFQVTADVNRFRALVRTLSTQQGAQILVPEVTRKASVTVVCGIGEQVFLIADRPTWLVDGISVLLVDGDAAELRTVIEATPTAVVFDEINTTFWSARTKVCWVLTARLLDNVQLSEPVAGVMDGQVVFMVEPGSEPVAETPAPDLIWNGREVFLERPNWGPGIDRTFARDVQQVDYGRGVVATYLPVDFGVGTRGASYIGQSAGQVQRLLDFFLRMQGCLGEFYAPTDEPDILLSTSAGGGATTLTIAGEDFAAAYGADRVHKAISVLMRDGQRFLRSVDTLVASSGSSLLHLTSGIPYAISAATVSAVCWAPVCRLASDEVTFEWLTDEVAQTRLIFQTLEALDPESPDDV